MRYLLSMLLFVSCLGVSFGAQGNKELKFPTRPITVVIPFGAGGGADRSSRMMTEYVAKQNGWRLIDENKPGANGLLGVSAIMNAPADGHTILISGPSTHGGNSALFKQLPYDPIGDFTALTRGVVVPLVLVVSPSLGIDSVAKLVELAKKKPGSITFASSNPTTRLAAEKFRQMADIDLLYVPYKTSPQTATDLVGQHVDIGFVDTITAGPFIQDGRLKALAITSPDRVATLKNVPTMIEEGYPGYDVSNWLAVYVRSGTDPRIVHTLAAAFASYTASQEGQEYAKRSSSYMTTLSQEKTQQWVASEISSYQTAYKQAGIDPQ